MMKLVFSARKAVAIGMLASALLITVYFAILTAISGWTFTLGQFADFWYYIVPLALGFGVQVGLHTALRQLLRGSKEAGAVVAASGTTSTAAMISCCAHYLTTVAPVLGAAGLVSFAAAYQVEFFWLGIAFNLAGIAYIGRKLINASKDDQRCAPA